MRYLTLLLFFFIAIGCSSGGDNEHGYLFVATEFSDTACEPYWMLERDGERYFVLDADLPERPDMGTWAQNGRPDDGVGAIVESPGLIVDTVTVGGTTLLYVYLPYSFIYEVMLPPELFNGDGTCIAWPPPIVEPPQPEPDPEPKPPSNDCNDDDHDRGHGNDCDGHDEDNPGNKHRKKKWRKWCKWWKRHR